MSSPSAPSASSATRELDSTRVSAGYRDAISLVLVPRILVSFEPVGLLVAEQLKKLPSLLIDFPIQGTARNVPPGSLPCALSWCVKVGEVTSVYPVDGAVMKVAAGGRFHVEVEGRVPVLDVVATRLIGKGHVGFSLTPDFPHAEPVSFAPSLAFDNVCAVRTQLPRPDETRLGSLVVFSPDIGWTFKRAELELRVIEVDEGSTEISSLGPPRSAFSHRWEAGGWHAEDRKWAIGFTDDTCEQLVDVGEEEAGSYEFGWQLWGRSRAEGPQTLLLEQRDFLRVPKPKLEDFKVIHDRTWEGTWEVSGRISGVEPRTRMMIDVALVEPAADAATAEFRGSRVRLALARDGSFEGHLGERHWPWSADPLAPAEPPAPEQVGPPAGPQPFAVLSFPAAARDGHPGPMAAYLDFDEARFSAFKGKVLSWDADADWICSEEGVKRIKRLEKPRRRKTGLTTNPAPPVDAGDQKTPITFEEMWLDMATEAEIEKAFKGVLALPKAMRATEYALRPCIALTDQVIRSLAKERLEGEFLPHLRRYFPDFDKAPRAARRGLLDLVYNVGIGKFPGTSTKPGKEFMFDNLTKAARAKDWLVAAENCHSSGTPENRNAWRKALFLYAATVEAKKKA